MQELFKTVLRIVAGNLMSLEMALMRIVAPPEYTGTLIAKSQVKALVNQFNYKFFQPLDATYREVTLDSVKEFLAKDGLSEYTYADNDFDCDDFQIVLAGRLKLWGRGIPSGLLFVEGHALNLIVAEQDGELKLFKIEPQNDIITEVSGDDHIVFIIL